MKSEITPLNQIDSEIVTVNLPLPPDILDGIGLDLPALESICKLIGISRLAISNLVSHPMATGVNSSGTATGSLTNTATSANSYEPNKIHWKCHRAIPANIQIDTQTISICENTEQIARAISTELRISLLKIGAKLMLADHNTIDIASFTSRSITTISSLAAILLFNSSRIMGESPPPLEILLIVELNLALIYNSFSIITATQFDLPFLLSLFTGYGIELDRFLILLFQLTTHRLIETVTYSK